MEDGMSQVDLRPTRRSLLAATGGLLLARRAAAQTPAAGPAQASGTESEDLVPAPKHGGSMTIMFMNEPAALISLVSLSSLTCSAKVTEGLLWYDHAMQPHPQLATAWTISPDQKTYTFTLRRDVRWHDGQPFTSADVAAS